MKLTLTGLRLLINSVSLLTLMLLILVIVVLGLLFVKQLVLQ